MKEMYDNKINVVDITPQKATIEIHSNLTNPEQYREKKQF
jgi:hypothetical protein